MLYGTVSFPGVHVDSLNLMRLLLRVRVLLSRSRVVSTTV